MEIDSQTLNLLEGRFKAKLQKITNKDLSHHPKKEHKIQYMSILSSISRTSLEANGSFKIGISVTELQINDDNKILQKEKNVILNKHPQDITKEPSTNVEECHRLKQEVEASEDLNHLYKDCELIKALFENDLHKEKFVEHDCIILAQNEKKDFSKAEIKRGLTEFFNCKKTPCKASILILSGNMNHDGRFLFQTNEDRKTIMNSLCYEDIFELWIKRENKNKNKSLLLIVDASYSGVWVEKCIENLHFTKHYGISIQASCGKEKQTLYVKNLGSLLLWNITQLNTKNINNIILASNEFYDKLEIKGEEKNGILNKMDINAKHSMIKNEEVDDINFKNAHLNKSSISYSIRDQTIMLNMECPICIGFFYKDSKRFYLDILINSWDDLFNNINNKEAPNKESIHYFSKHFTRINYPNGFYFGESKNNTPHGFGFYITNKLNDRGQKIYEGNFIEGVYEGYGLLYENNYVYEGEFLQWKKNGRGSIIFYNKESYLGNFYEDKYEGLGIMYYNNGDKYIGRFVNNKKEKCGKLYFKNGNNYFGDFSNDQMTGFGIFSYKNGNSYIGYLKNQSFDNVGIFTYCGGDVFTGQFAWDKKTRIGSLKCINGDIIEGEFLEDCMDGIINYNFANGNVLQGKAENGTFNEYSIFKYDEKESFEGKYFGNKKSGYGIYNFSNGDIYQGTFLNGVKHGTGKYIFCTGDIYEGEFVNGSIEGFGKIIYKNGDIYTGEFQDNKKHGNGSYTFKSGNVYKGPFKNGVAEGKGLFLYADENGEIKKYFGEYENDKRHGKGVLLLKNNKKLNCEYLNGKLIY